jgi:DNA polymerase-3 subunit epsilon
MFRKLYLSFQKKRLKDKNFLYLFDENSSDEVIVFDTETTGLNPKSDEIISIGAVKVKGNKILTSEKFHIFIKSEKESHRDAIKIHKIRNCDLENGLAIEDGIEKFLRFIGSRTLVGYYLEFDVAMVNKYIKPLIGVNLPNRQIEVSALYFDKKIGKIPQGNIDLRFDTIAKDLDIPIFGKHDALNDSIMTALIYLKLG